MADIMFRLDSPMAVEVIHTGHVVAFADLPEGQLGLFFQPAAADETGRRLREAARGDAGAAIPSGEVAKISIAPPAGGAAGELILTLKDGREVTLDLPLAGLSELSKIAARALAAVAPSGRA